MALAERAEFGMAYGMAVKYTYVRKVIHMERDRLKALIEDYVSGLETELTEAQCRCEWLEMDTAFGKRKVRQSVNLECPVHTREGLILAFVEKNFRPALFPENAVKMVGDFDVADFAKVADADERP